jgi:hypothetical protein
MTFWDNYVSKLEAMSLDPDSLGVPLMVLRYEDLCLHLDAVGCCLWSRDGGGEGESLTHHAQGTQPSDDKHLLIVPLCVVINCVQIQLDSAQTCTHSHTHITHMQSRPPPALPVGLQVMPRLLRFLGASVTSNETLARVMKTPCSPISRYFGSNLRFLSIKEFDFVVRAAGDIVSRYGWVSCVILAAPLTVRLAAVRWALLLTLCPPLCATSCCPVGTAGRPLSAS